jgi:hypothetical protein
VSDAQGIGCSRSSEKYFGTLAIVATRLRHVVAYWDDVLSFLGLEACWKCGVARALHGLCVEICKEIHEKAVFYTSLEFYGMSN